MITTGFLYEYYILIDAYFLLLPPASEVWRKVIFSVACAKNSVSGGVPGQVPSGRYTPLGRYTPRADKPLWHVHPLAGTNPAGIPTHPRAGTPPPEQCML